MNMVEVQKKVEPKIVDPINIDWIIFDPKKVFFSTQKRARPEIRQKMNYKLRSKIGRQDDNPESDSGRIYPE